MSNVFAKAKVDDLKLVNEDSLSPVKRYRKDDRGCGRDPAFRYIWYSDHEVIATMFVSIINNYVSTYCDMDILEKYKVISSTQSEKWEKVLEVCGEKSM